MSYSFEPISHPDRTLAEHLEACDCISAQLIAKKFVNEDTFFPKEDLKRWRKALVFFHDLGKATHYFQSYLLSAMLKEAKHEVASGRFADYFAWAEQNFFPYTQKELSKHPQLSNHAKLGAYFMVQALPHDEELLIKIILLKIVRRHHGALTNFSETGDDGTPQITLTAFEKEELAKQVGALHHAWLVPYLQKHGFQLDIGNWPVVAEQFSLQRPINKLSVELEKAKDYRYFFLQHFLFSLLLSADKGDVMLERGISREHLLKEPTLYNEGVIPIFKQSVFQNQSTKPIDLEREDAFRVIISQAQEHSNNSFFSITLPTGMGKTFAAFHTAIILQNAFNKQYGTVPRIVYCLPFTSIIDQNAAILEKIFEINDLNSSQLATHHHLSPLKEVYDESVVSIKESEYLTEGWEHSWIITTFVQFFESLFSNRNSALRKFHNMANAIIILDEIQNIPPKYFEAIEISCRKMADYFGTKFVFVTATQPLLFADSSAVKELTTPKTKHFFEKRDRIVINQHLLRQAEKITLEALTAHAEGEVGTKPGKSFLLIANTIAQSQKLYNLLELVGLPIFYLSGSILPVFRKQLIEHIKALDGSKILVSTQVVEAGVDIDFDVVYRDFAPLDSINQSAGRCNRNGIKGKGFVYLYDSGNARIYDSVLLSITKRVLACFEDEIPEAKFWELNQQYFLDVRKAVAEASDESAALLKAMQRLQLDDIERDFILISELPIYYNVFVPFEENDLKNLSYPVEITTDEMPLAVWAQYEACTAIENPFERKELLRQVMPKVLSYVAKFPKKHYSPARQDQVDKAFIFETSWRDYYDLEKGFQVPSNTSSVLMI